MVSEDDIHQICLCLPGVSEESPLSVLNKDKYRGIAWVWNERIDVKKPRVPNPEVYAVRTTDVDERDALIAAEPEKYFTEPHYNGFPAVLVRLANVEIEEIEELLIDGWRALAPKPMAKQYTDEQLLALVRSRHR
jgi:hypothetical protein